MVCAVFIYLFCIFYINLFLHPTYHPLLSKPSNFCLFLAYLLFAASHFFILPLSSCQIDWHKGKDVTVKTIKKKQKHKGRGTVRTVTKQLPNDSFFNFFNPVKGESTQTRIMFGISQELSKILLSLNLKKPQKKPHKLRTVYRSAKPPLRNLLMLQEMGTLNGLVASVYMQVV